MSVMIIDMWDERLTYPNLKKRVLSNFDEIYGDPEEFHGGKKPDLILIEDKSAGISLIQELGAESLPVYGYNPGKADKVQRLSVVSWIVQKGLIYLPESETKPGLPKSWTDAGIRQICIFPEAEHDDYVDAFSQGLRYIADSGWLKVHRDRPRDNSQDYVDAQLISNTGRGNPYAQ